MIERRMCFSFTAGIRPQFVSVRGKSDPDFFFEASHQ
jgi:hypothetical protein